MYQFVLFVILISFLNVDEALLSYCHAYPSPTSGQRVAICKGFCHVYGSHALIVPTWPARAFVIIISTNMLRVVCMFDVKPFYFIHQNCHCLLM